MTETKRIFHHDRQQHTVPWALTSTQNFCRWILKLQFHQIIALLILTMALTMADLIFRYCENWHQEGIKSPAHAWVHTHICWINVAIRISTQLVQRFAYIKRNTSKNERGRRNVGSGSYSKLKAQRTNDDIYMGLDLPYHSNRQKGKLQARNQTKNERFMATPNFSKEKLLCLVWAGGGWVGGGAGEEVCVCGGVQLSFSFRKQNTS